MAALECNRQNLRIGAELLEGTAEVVADLSVLQSTFVVVEPYLCVVSESEVFVVGLRPCDTGHHLFRAHGHGAHLSDPSQRDQLGYDVIQQCQLFILMWSVGLTREKLCKFS